MKRRNQTHRAQWHDYRAKCIYMVTINKLDGVADFGKIAGCPKLVIRDPSSVECALSKLGFVIRRHIVNWTKDEPVISIMQYSIMPDHVHILLEVTEYSDVPLGKMIARFKDRINDSWRGEPVFERGFNDQILKVSRSLDRLYRYIRENPYRLAVRKEFPAYFTSVKRIQIADHWYQAYGNLFLLQNPFKTQVVVHRSDTENDINRKIGECMYVGENGGVIVSPFISKREKEIKSMVEEAGGKVILIRNKSMGPREKPGGHDFELCEEGRLLIIEPIYGQDIMGNPSDSFLSTNKSVSRSECMAMNNLAKFITENLYNTSPSK